MNNRKLKFRIWKKSMKRWLCEDCQYLQMDGKKVHAAPWSTLEWDIPSDDYIIQQFTGEYDKNKKEIYEGDIIRSYSEEFINENYTGEVVFVDAGYHVKVNEKDYMGIWSGDDIEVIGNIFETPELLKQ